MTPPLDDETVEFLKRTPPPRDLDAEPDPDAPPSLVLPADADPERWGSLEDVLRDVDRAVSFEQWAEQEVEREE